MENIFDLKLESLGRKTAHTGNPNKKDTENFRKKQKPIHYWSLIVNFKEQITYDNHFLNQSLWYNSLKTIDNRYLFYPE